MKAVELGSDLRPFYFQSSAYMELIVAARVWTLDCPGFRSGFLPFCSFVTLDRSFLAHCTSVYVNRDDKSTYTLQG